MACANPQPMLEFLQGRASDRKLRLFACACCRRVWQQINLPSSRDTVEAAERYADALISAEELARLHRNASSVLSQCNRAHEWSGSVTLAPEHYDVPLA